MEALGVSGYPETSGPAEHIPFGHMTHPESLQLRSPGWTTNCTEGGFVLLLLPEAGQLLLPECIISYMLSIRGGCLGHTLADEPPVSHQALQRKNPVNYITMPISKTLPYIRRSYIRCEEVI